MKKKLLRETRPDVFNMIKDKATYYNIGVGTQKEVELICPICGCILTQRINNVVKFGISCKRCGDGISFGEKFVFNILEQLKVDFDIHVKFGWSNGKIYDVGLYNNKQLIGLIEIHGDQHYNQGFATCGGRTYEEEVENDNYKKDIALKNGISNDMYIIVDCRISSFNYIKSSIENNKFFNQYDLSKIDWSLCAKNATSSYTAKAWNLWEAGYNVGLIAKQLKVNRYTVRRYLKHGAQAGLCSYSIEESSRRGINAIRNVKHHNVITA
jgi:hypothetical protein